VCRFFNWLGYAEQQKQEEARQQQQQQQQHEPERPQPQEQPHGIPREFPGIVYRTLRFYPDAMKALARAIKEFYEGTHIGEAEILRQPPGQTTPKAE
jgi:hypothetical protein